MTTQKKTTIGGQAIIEGIVMKGPKKTCTVVRKAGGELVVKEEDAHQPSILWKKPVFRGAYGLFMALAGSVLSSGTRINLTFTSIVALAVSLTHCRHTVTVLSQRREIDQMNQQLLLLLQKDPLTGLLNQAAFQQYGQELLAARAAALYIMDLDNFKRVNDRYGHPCGDYVLQQTAKALQAAFPSGAAIGRIGGDEFAVLLSAPFGAAGPEAPALRLLREMAGITWQEHPLEVSCSVGICLTSRPGVPYDQVYRLADDALYQVKRTGKGRTHLSIL